ncbi:MAG: hypothetical protein RL660_855 [Bacteroidota bacterium]|jgi:hypothetical protein
MNFSKNPLVLCIVIAFLATGCSKPNANKEVIVNERPTRSASQFEHDYDNTIRAAGYGLLAISQNAQFRNIVAQELSKKFDGDDNVLIKTLSVRCDEVGINLYASMHASLIQQGKAELIEYLDDAIGGLDYFDTKVYVQVFVPFIENQNLSLVPKIAFNFTDESVLQGISINGAEFTPISLTEADAEQNLVYVISINEVVDGNANIPSAPQFLAPRSTRSSRVFLNINKINVSDKKEGWGNGRADISFVAFQIKPQCIISPVSGQPFEKVSDNQLNTWISPACGACQFASFTNGSNLPSSSWEQDEALTILYFEMDRRNMFNKTENIWPSCGSSGNVTYCSKESKYGTCIPVRSDFNTTSGASMNYGGLTGMDVELWGWLW